MPDTFLFLIDSVRSRMNEWIKVCRLDDIVPNTGVCARVGGEQVAVFRVDRQTGRLIFTGHYAPVRNPSSIVFLDLAKVG